MKILMILINITFCFWGNAIQPTPPQWTIQAFQNYGLEKLYKIQPYLKTAYIESDFNNDGNQDVAVLVVEKRTAKKGIIIFHQKKNEYFVLGAGKAFGNGSDNFDWLNIWYLIKEKYAFETTFNESGDMIGSKKILLKNPSLVIGAMEDGAMNAGGIVYWTGKKYRWIHQGE